MENGELIEILSNPVQLVILENEQLSLHCHTIKLCGLL